MYDTCEAEECNRVHAQLTGQEGKDFFINHHQRDKLKMKRLSMQYLQQAIVEFEKEKELIDKSIKDLQKIINVLNSPQQSQETSSEKESPRSQYLRTKILDFLKVNHLDEFSITGMHEYVESITNKPHYICDSVPVLTKNISAKSIQTACDRLVAKGEIDYINKSEIGKTYRIKKERDQDA